jgi:hypothetical protein
MGQQLPANHFCRTNQIAGLLFQRAGFFIGLGQGLRVSQLGRLVSGV